MAGFFRPSQRDEQRMRRFMSIRATGIPTVTDASFSSVVSLLHFDGANASTTFTDQIGKVWTPGGSAKLDTSTVKFGSAAGLFDSLGYISSPSHADFALPGDFTIECWLNRVNTSPTYQPLWYTNVTGGATFSLKAGKLSFGANSVADHLTAPALCAFSTWVHVAVTRSGSTLRIFEAGVVTATVTQAYSYAQGVASIGATSSGGISYTGYMDDMRVTKGVARYTANFTPPSEAFPNS